MSKSAALLLILVFLTALCPVMPLSVNAESKTITVPDDFPTIEAAIGNATDGDMIFVKKGTYEENPLKINKSLSLIGEGADSTKISFDPPYTEFTVNIFEHHIFYENPLTISADGFQMSGLTVITTGGYILINGNGNRITDNKITTDIFFGGSYLSILENTFSAGLGFNGNYCKISSNTFGGSGTFMGLHVSGQYNIVSSNNFNGGVTVDGSFFLVDGNKAANGGTFSVGGENNIVSNNIIDHMETGLAVGGSNNTVFLNTITHCGMGLSPRAGNVFYANYVANNAWAIYTGDTQLNPDGNASVLFNNNFVNNAYQVDTISINAFKNDSFDNGKVGNYWSDYRGKDVDGDGIGDTPYVIDANRSDRYPLMKPFDTSIVSLELPDWAAQPSVHIINPENATSTSENVTLGFTVSKQVLWIGYSLDGQDNVTVIGNTTINGLRSGLHTVTVYAEDAFENEGASETITFNVEEPFPTTLVIAASGACVAIVGVGLLVYFKKRKR
jgi:nitrous oxidase accessory protein NosD